MECYNPSKWPIINGLFSLGFFSPPISVELFHNHTKNKVVGGFFPPRVVFFQPSWKICASQIGSFPQVSRVAIFFKKNVRNHHLDTYPRWLLGLAQPHEPHEPTPETFEVFSQSNWREVPVVDPVGRCNTLEVLWSKKQCLSGFL